MSDYVTIANLAGSKIGADDQLRDPDQDSTFGRSIRAVWDPVRKAVLRAGKFNFSLRRFELAAQNPLMIPAPPSAYPYANRFPLPAESLRLVEVIGPSSIVASYKNEGGAILANTDGPVFVLCVIDIVETALWDDLFAEAFACRLAFQVADRITGDRGRKADCWASYRQAISLAAGVDAKEDPPTEAEDSSWITARFA